MPKTPEFTPVASPYLVPFDGSFRAAKAPTEKPKSVPGKRERIERLAELRDRIGDLQHRMYANDYHALLVVFQGLDAAGKDSAIRALFTGANPTGVRVSSFKQPSREELDHDFLWRTSQRAPERGCIGVFNRSHYEEVLVVRVHPEYLGGQRLPQPIDHEQLWQGRFASIRDWEEHLARTGTAVVKFWLNVSREEQYKRFLDRLDTPEKHWKFSSGDLRESDLRDEYIHAFEDALNATSRPAAPWYAIPADSKSYARMVMAEILVERLESFGLSYPEVADEERAQFEAARKKIRGVLGC